MLKYAGALIVVEDIARSRYFYEQLLGQQVRYDFGENIEFMGGFSIHLQPHFETLLAEAGPVQIVTRAHNGELYFDSDRLEEDSDRLKQAGVAFVHPLREQPWGQRVLRVYDPDGHIVEIGETLEAVALRLYSQGQSIEEIVTRIGMPLEFVKQAVRS